MATTFSANDEKKGRLSFSNVGAIPRTEHHDHHFAAGDSCFYS